MGANVLFILDQICSPDVAVEVELFIRLNLAAVPVLWFSEKFSVPLLFIVVPVVTHIAEKRLLVPPNSALLSGKMVPLLLTNISVEDPLTIWKDPVSTEAVTEPVAILLRFPEMPVEST